MKALLRRAYCVISLDAACGQYDIEHYNRHPSEENSYSSPKCHPVRRQDL